MTDSHTNQLAVLTSVHVAIGVQLEVSGRTRACELWFHITCFSLHTVYDPGNMTVQREYTSHYSPTRYLLFYNVYTLFNIQIETL